MDARIRRASAGWSWAAALSALRRDARASVRAAEPTAAGALAAAGTAAGAGTPLPESPFSAVQPTIAARRTPRIPAPATIVRRRLLPDDRCGVSCAAGGTSGSGPGSSAGRALSSGPGSSAPRSGSGSSAGGAVSIVSGAEVAMASPLFSSHSLGNVSSQDSPATGSWPREETPAFDGRRRHGPERPAQRVVGLPAGDHQIRLGKQGSALGARAATGHVRLARQVPAGVGDDAPEAIVGVAHGLEREPRDVPGVTVVLVLRGVQLRGLVLADRGERGDGLGPDVL